MWFHFHTLNMFWFKNTHEKKKKTLFDYESQFDYAPLISENQGNSVAEKNTNAYRSAFQYSSKLDSDFEIDSASKESLFSLIVRISLSFICYVTLILTFPISVWLCIKRVPSLERIVVFRLGRRLPLKGPGLVIVLPCVDNVVKVDLRPKIIRISPQQVLTSDGGIIEVKAHFECHTVDVVHSVLSVKDVDDIVKQLGQYCLVNIFSDKDVEDAEKKRNILQHLFKEQLNRSLLSWGLEATVVEIPPVRVIKAGEPSTAMTSLVTALKSSFGIPNSNEPSQTSPPALIAHGPLALAAPTKSDTLKDTKADDTTNSKVIQLQHLLNSLICKINNNDDFKIKDAVICLDVVGNEETSLYCVISNGKASICNAAPNGSKPNVVITSTADILFDILVKNQSPVQMLWENKVEVAGDLNILKEILEVAESSSS